MSSLELRKYRDKIRGLLNELNEDILKIDSNRKRIVYITPHLSTGGMPQYLLKKIEVFNDIADIYCILWSDNAQIYDVQKKQISRILGEKLIILGDEKEEIIDIIENQICPDIIHFEDIPERFVYNDIMEYLYRKNRPYFICETPHSSTTNPQEKIYLPDRFIMVNKWMVEHYKEIDSEFEILEYYLEPVEKFDKDEYRAKLGLSEDKKHIINVGLFTPGKNQAEAIEYAKSFIGEPVEFHFLGNQAPNFKEYWEPLLEKIPDNCNIWGEVDNVDDFYRAADLFLFTSKHELAPIVIRESIAYRLPILMNHLPSYMDDYSNNEYVNYLTENKEDNIEKIKRIIKL